VAAEHLPPSAVVFGRALLGAVFLLPLAMRTRAFRGLRRGLLPVAVLALLDMALPTFLTAWGEERVTSSVARSSPPPTGDRNPGLFRGPRPGVSASSRGEVLSGHATPLVVPADRA
jgi:EamA-like transporter family protein